MASSSWKKWPDHERDKWRDHLRDIDFWQERPELSAGPSAASTVTWQPRTAPVNAAQRSAHPVMTANLPGLDNDMLDVPVGLDVQEGGDFSSWFPDGLDDSLPQDCDFSGVLEVPDDDLTQLGLM